MIDDVVVIDAVAHALDLRPENWNHPKVCEPFREFGYLGIHQLAVPAEEPEWGLGREGFDEILADTDVVESVIFRESWTDACFYHEIPMYGMFKGGLARLQNGLDLRDRHPERVKIYGGVSPFEHGAVEKVDQLVEEHNVNALKLYPADLYESEVAPYGALRQYKMDDPDLVYPILERARHHGLIVAIHKAIPLGPVPMEPFRVDDLDAAFMAYPDLPIEIVHGGFAFLDETMNQVMRFPNAYVTLEATASLLAKAPDKFALIVASLLAVGAEDRILWGTGAALAHPQPLLERFWNLEFSQEILDMTASPPLTKEIKRKILGENAARLHNIDLDALRRVVEDENLTGDGFAPPWSVARNAA
jgi:predicted TIM-barrel fold metal-dependent hydrolase